MPTAQKAADADDDEQCANCGADDVALYWNGSDRLCGDCREY
jgi:hypothetical protein